MSPTAVIWTDQGVVLTVATIVEGLEGKVIHGWLLEKEIGRGADGVVYAAEKDGQRVAIKLYFPDVLKKNGVGAAKERLELQLGIAGKKHDNLVTVISGGEVVEYDTLYVVMELVPGTSLDKLLGKVPSEAIPSLAYQLAVAGEQLEKLGLVHRDIKPANIIIDDAFERLTLLDLGIVHRALADDDKGELSGAEFVAKLVGKGLKTPCRHDDRFPEHLMKRQEGASLERGLHAMHLSPPFVGHGQHRQAKQGGLHVFRLERARQYRR